MRTSEPMEDFSTLASRITSAGEVIGSILVSARDGMVVGAFPPETEGIVKTAWHRSVVLGETRRGFVVFDTEVWAFVRAQNYSAFALATPSAKPGVLLDRLEQVLQTAEEWRAREDRLTPDEDTVSITASSDLPSWAKNWARAQQPAPAAQTAQSGEERGAAEPPPRAHVNPEDVDRVDLAREFAGLLQEPPEDDEEVQ
jgi:hypothetical protein